MTFYFKVIYVIKQMLLVPIHSGYFLMVETGKNIHSRLEEEYAQTATQFATKNAANEDSANDPCAGSHIPTRVENNLLHQGTKGVNNDILAWDGDGMYSHTNLKQSLAHQVIIRYARWANSVGLTKMGIPFNRFIAFSASYFLFLLIIITLILKPIMEHRGYMEEHPLLNWTNCHYMILIYTLALLEKDFENVYRLKSIHRVLSNFWRVYDVIFHLFFVAHLILYLGLQMIPHVNTCITRTNDTADQPFTKFMKDSNVTDVFIYKEQNCAIVAVLLSVSGVVFAIGTF